MASATSSLSVSISLSTPASTPSPISRGPKSSPRTHSITVLASLYRHHENAQHSLCGSLSLPRKGPSFRIRTRVQRCQCCAAAAVAVNELFGRKLEVKEFSPGWIGIRS
uniref:Uncharacterized protein n=1 Tax=Salix viminalis TaxID=40686 RepID=A0A6N2L6G7_SALVM